MSGLATVGLAAGFVLWFVFVAVNVSIAFEIAEVRNRRAAAWAAFAFLFPVAGPFLVWLAPTRTRR